MRRFAAFNWPLSLATPLVGGLIVFGLWASVTAAYENVRLAHAVGQTLGAVKVARDMGVRANDMADRATASLLYRLSYMERITAMTLSGVVQKGFLNPWGGFVGLTVAPADQALKIEAVVPPRACRRLIQFYGKDPARIGLKRVEVRDRAALAISRQLYSAPSGGIAAGMTTNAIKAGCGAADEVVVTLTFKLS